ncbi:MAG: superoxide dismutase [Pyrinomonadaceae bacterium]|nr:superoxide dismutase [Pyrinomonadaceae bacterium]
MENQDLAQTAKYPFELPALGYAPNALEPFIDAETMTLHHDKHHQTYVDKLNDALKDHEDLHVHTLAELLKNLDTLPEAVRTAVKNHGGGHANHAMFWTILKRNEGTVPTGELATAIEKSFGSFDDFKKQFNDAGAKLFGSGWVFLVKDGDGVKLHSLPNQESPLLHGINPILGNDVWEHAYYVTYRNRRPDYLAAWWNVVDWDAVSERFSKQ